MPTETSDAPDPVPVPDATPAPRGWDCLSAEEADWLAAELAKLAGAESTAPPPQPEPVETPPPPPPPAQRAIEVTRSRRPSADPPGQVLYSRVVANGSRGTIHGVCVEHDLPPNARCVGVSDGGYLRGNCLVWDLGHLAPGARIQLRVKVEPIDPTLPFEVEHAHFRITHTLTSAVRAPEIVVATSGPWSLPLNDAAPFHLHVENRGNAPAAGGRVELWPGEGFLSAGEGPLTVDLGDLLPAESVDLVFHLRAVTPGRQSVSAVLTWKDRPDWNGNWPVEVLQPALAARWTGPARCYAGHEYETAIEVTNPGTAAAAGVSVRYRLPDGAELLWAEEGLTHEPAERALAAGLERLDPGATWRKRVRLRAELPGDLGHVLDALADGELQTRAEGTINVDFDPTAPAHALEQLVERLDRFAPEAAAAPRAARVERRAADEPYVLFALAGTQYAVPIKGVLEIGRPPSVTPMPNVPDWVEGVANFRGDVISVVNLRAFLGLPPAPPGDLRMLVARSAKGDVVTGLLVDAAHGIRPLDPSLLRPAPESGVAKPYIRGLSETDGRLLVVLDIDRLLTGPEMTRFNTD